MTQPNNETNPTNNTPIEEVPPSGIDTYARRAVTDYVPDTPIVIDTGTDTLKSPTVQEVVAQREDNPFLRLAVIAGCMGLVIFFLWGIFAFLSPKAPVELAEDNSDLDKTEKEAEDHQAKLALRDQFHALEKKQPEPEPVVAELPPVTPPPAPPPTVAVAPRPVPRPVSRPVPRPAPRVAPRVAPKPAPKKVEPELSAQEQWLNQANFGVGVSSRSVASGNKPQTIAKRRNTSSNNPLLAAQSANPQALLVNSPNSLSQGAQGILNRRAQSSFPQPAPAVMIDRGIIKGKIELPLVWDSSLAPEQQQSNQITVVLEEAIYDLEGNTLFEEDSVAIVQVDSINDTNGLVTAYVVQINETVFERGDLILRNKKKSALVAKASKRSDFGDRLLVGGVDTLSGFGQQLLIPESSSTASNGSTIVTNQSRNSIGRDLAGSALDGFGSSLSTELNQRSARNQIGDGGTIFTLSQGETVYLTNIKPIKVNF